MKNFLHVIHDYPGDIAGTEVIAAIAAHLPEGWHWKETPVPAMDTLSTGFAVEQLALQRPPLCPANMKLFVNCAPRKDRRTARRNNEGEGLVFCRLDNGVELIAVNSGYSLSWIRDHIVEMRDCNCPLGGSQFRSRDYFPAILGQLTAGDLSFLGKRLRPKQVIPAPVRGQIRHRDNFGNMKTDFREGDRELQVLRPGERIRININGVVRAATVATGNFNVDDGDIAFAPGSSGHDRRYWEIFLRGGSAWQLWDQPRIGSRISFEKGSSYGARTEGAERRPPRRRSNRAR